LAQGVKAHPANYRGCRHAKEQLQKRKSQRTPKTTTKRVFSNLKTIGASFAAALRGSAQKQQRPQALQVPVASPPVAKKRVSRLLNSYNKTGQSVWATNVKFVSGQNVEDSSNGSTSDYDRV
jgi:hypothetical protein